MVKIMENPIKMDDLGIFGGTIIFGNTHIDMQDTIDTRDVRIKSLKDDMILIRTNL